MKRALSLAGAASLALAVTSPLAAAPKPKVVLEDPIGDANFINDQGTSDGSFGDIVTPADVSSVTDIEEISLSNDAKNLYIVFGTEAGPPATQGVGYRLRVNPDGPGGSYCLHFEAFYPGAGNNLTVPQGHLRDTCGGGAPIPIEVVGPNMTVPRKAHEALGKGATLAAPQAQGFIFLGTYAAGVPAPTADTTKVGTDYKFVDKRSGRS